MIVADSSILVGFLRKPTAAHRRIMETQPIAICGCVVAELLAGARGDEERHRISEALGGFTYLATSEAVWPALGDNLRQLRAKGLVLPFQDVLIATTAIQHSFPVWTHDAHFRTMRSVLTILEIFEESNLPGQSHY